MNRQLKELKEFNSMEELAKDSGVDKKTLYHAATVLRHGTAEVVGLVKNGKVHPKHAAAYVKKTPPSQQQADPAVIHGGQNCSDRADAHLMRLPFGQLVPDDDCPAPAVRTFHGPIREYANVA